MCVPVQRWLERVHAAADRHRRMLQLVLVAHYFQLGETRGDPTAGVIVFRGGRSGPLLRAQNQASTSATTLKAVLTRFLF